MSDIAAKVEAVQQRIETAARRSGRTGADVTLVAVTKTHPVETVIEAYQAGLRHFGENRAAEGRDKVAQLKSWLADQPDPVKAPTWHFIGHLQSRQVGDVLGRFGLLHATDSLKLAQRLNRLAERDTTDLPVEVLLQCNVSGEAAKYGFDLSEWASNVRQLATFIDIVEQIAKLEMIVIRGVMTMAPFFDDPQATRPVFQNLAALRKRLQRELPHIDWSHLSMGMTNDFEVAIEEGATIVRVGRAIFGERIES